MRAKRVIKASDFDLRSPASSTSVKIFDAVDSVKAFVVRIIKTLDVLMQPESTASPVPTFRGRLSPVSARVSSVALPSSITPSIGTRSPGLTRICAPTATVSGSTVSSLPSAWTRRAKSGRISISPEISSRLLPTA